MPNGLNNGNTVEVNTRSQKEELLCNLERSAQAGNPIRTKYRGNGESEITNSTDVLPARQIGFVRTSQSLDWQSKWVQNVATPQGAADLYYFDRENVAWDISRDVDLQFGDATVRAFQGKHDENTNTFQLTYETKFRILFAYAQDTWIFRTGCSLWGPKGFDGEWPSIVKNGKLSSNATFSSVETTDGSQPTPWNAVVDYFWRARRTYELQDFLALEGPVSYYQFQPWSEDYLTHEKLGQ